MPINKLVPSKRAAAAIAAAIATASAAGWHSTKDTDPVKHVYPPAVILASEHLIKTWEGVVLKTHYDPFAKINDICYGKTRINGKPIPAGMTVTLQQCQDWLREDLFAGYYQPLTKKITGYTSFPIGNQASQLSGGYNFGVGAMSKSTAARLATEAYLLSLKGETAKATAKYLASCEAQRAFDKAGGQKVRGLELRRGMGDKQRMGEGEVCVTGQVK